MAEPRSEIPATQETKTEQPVDWKALKEQIARFLEKSMLTVAVFLTIVAMVAPQLIANAQEFDETFCTLRSVMTEDAETTTIRCTSSTGEEVELNLEFLIKNYDVSVYSEDHIEHPPFFTSEFASDINNPNFNCHSRTLQLLQESAGVDFGAGRDRWLEAGLDDFLRQFGNEVIRMESIPQQMTEDVIDTTLLQPGDVILFFDNESTLIHSATVSGKRTSDEGVEYTEIINKLGEAGELNSSIDDMVRLYDLWGEYDSITQSGGGSIFVYRPDFDRIRVAFETPTT